MYNKKPRCLNKERSIKLLMVWDMVLLSVVFGAGVGFGPIGRMREPATQQLKRRPPRIMKLPLQPNLSKNHVFKGARVERKTGLPAMASPLAIGRFLKKYFPIIVRAGLRLKASPKPAKKKKKQEQLNEFLSLYYKKLVAIL